MDRPFSAILSAASLLATLLLTILAMMALQAIWKTTDLQGPSPSTVGNAPAVDKDMLINNSTVTSPLVGATPSLSAAGSVDRAGIPATSDNLGATPVPFPTPTPGPTTTPFPAAPQNPRFGIAWSSSFYNSQRPNLPTGKAIEAGATWDRWPMSWHMVEPNGDGRFRWVSQDINFFLGVTQDRPRYAEPASPDPELQILVVLSDIPERYIQVQDGQIESILGLGEPVFLAGNGEGESVRINPENRWGHFIYQATSTFGEVVDGWEIGNEQGFPLPSDPYVRAMEIACQVIGVTDPTAQVLLGSPEHPLLLETAQGRETPYHALLTALASAVRESAALRECISGLALHVYAQPDHSPFIITHIADLTDQLGWHPDLWITETGIQHPDRDDPDRLHPHRCRETGFDCVSDEEQASYLIQQYVLSIQALAQKQRDGVVIYHRLKDEFDRDPRPNVNDGPWGLLDFEDRVLPAYNAARLVSAVLGDGRYLQEQGEKDSTYRHLVFSDHAQRRVHVLWATTAQAATVSVPLPTGQPLCYQQDIALCTDAFHNSTEGTLSLTLPGATAQATRNPDDPFYPAPIVGGRTFVVVEYERTSQ